MKPNFSFEFFPTQTEAGQAKLLNTFKSLQALSPQYFSVTYGAGGSTRTGTLSIVEELLREGGTPVVPHISCIGDSKQDVASLLDLYRSYDIDKVVALRGDLPSGQVGMGELPFARDLVEFIREYSDDYFHIAVAAYPEMHPQARSFEDDIINLVEKFKAGADSAITQFFYNADSYLHLRDSLERHGIDTEKTPLIPGIMPITNSSNLLRFADGCGADIPRYIRKQLMDFGDDRKAIKDFGFDVVYRLGERLLKEGVNNLHFYSMNRVEPNKQLVEALGLSNTLDNA